MAQPAPNPNPAIPASQLMQLMLSQPPVDVNSPVTAEAVLDPPVIGVGETAVYRIRVNALEASVHWPRHIPLPPGLEMVPTAQAQLLSPAGTVLRPLTARNYHVRASRSGFFTIPAFALEANGKQVVVHETPLEVAAKLEAEDEPARLLVLVPPRTNVFVGETLRVRVFAPSVASNLVEHLTQLQFNGEGFLGDKSLLAQSVEMLDWHGRKWPARLLESSVTPIAVGRQRLSAQAFTLGWQSLGPVVLSGPIAARLTGTSQYQLLDSEPLILNVQPLPSEGSAGFTGFIGSLSLESVQLSTNSLRVGDAIRMLVTFRSESSLSRFTPPDPPRLAGWQVFAAMPADPPPTKAPVASQRVAYAYTMIPMSEEVHETPAFPFRVFDPVLAAYQDVTVPALSVQVSAEGLPVDWKPANWIDEPRSKQKPILSALVESPGRSVGSLTPLQLRLSFVGLQLAPAALLFLLWRWDQRRRYLAAHPEVVRRRQARRALRRERRALRQAAQRGDAPGFTARAVAALRMAAAPHFPAEPRALVCSEVLSLFSEPERTGKTGQLIRTLFNRDEDRCFAAQPEPPSAMFAFKPELDSILKNLEARL